MKALEKSKTISKEIITYIEEYLELLKFYIKNFNHLEEKI